MDYRKHLLAEMESLASGTPSSTTTPPTTTTTRMKELRLGPRNGESGTSASASPISTASPATAKEDMDKGGKKDIPCRYFAKTAKGCSRGNRCPYKHAWEGADKRERCLACGGKGHLAKECPMKKVNGQPRAAPKATSGTSSTTTTSTPSASTTARAVRIDESRSANVEPTLQDSLPVQGSSVAATADIKEMLSEAGKMLKALTTTQLKLSSS